MTNPTPDQINRLPKWAQDRIQSLERQRNEAIRTLYEFRDAMTVSPYFYDDMICIGEAGGMSNVRRYVQTRRMEVRHAGLRLSVSLHQDSRIFLSWSSEDGGECAFIPTNHQQAELVAKANMR